MTLDEYQSAARRTINPSLSDQERLLDAVMGLSEEAGELLSLVRKRTFQSRDVPRAKLVEELGDTLWCLAIAADSLGMSLEEVANCNVKKLERRHPDGLTTRRTPEGWSRTSRE
jgi:NTP pyrophosphatase (non-canonical NTP hydrolase)